MKWHYFSHLVSWTGPVIGLQWGIGWRIFRRNLGAIFGPTCTATLYFTLCDNLAVRQGIWFFDEQQILGWRVGTLPVEEVLFFFLTSLLVAQTLILLLPKAYRHA